MHGSNKVLKNKYINQQNLPYDTKFRFLIRHYPRVNELNKENWSSSQI